MALVHIEDDTHRKLKILAAKRRLKIKDLSDKIIREMLEEIECEESKNGQKNA